MSTEIQFPDGVDVSTSRPKFLPAMLAPELMMPQATGNDLSYIAGPGGSHGYQPITNTNPDGDYPGVTLMSPQGTPASDPGSGGPGAV